MDRNQVERTLGTKIKRSYAYSASGRNSVLSREFYTEDIKTSHKNKKKFQLVLPEALREIAFKGIHDDLGHFAIERTLDLAKSRFFWTSMTKDIKNRIKTCKSCVLRRSPQPHRVAPLVNLSSSEPMELMCIDYLKVDRSKGGYENILLTTDHFTRYAQAIPTLNQTAKTTARVLLISS